MDINLDEIMKKHHEEHKEEIEESEKRFLEAKKHIREMIDAASKEVTVDNVYQQVDYLEWSEDEEDFGFWADPQLSDVKELIINLWAQYERLLKKYERIKCCDK